MYAVLRDTSFAVQHPTSPRRGHGDKSFLSNNGPEAIPDFLNVFKLPDAPIIETSLIDIPYYLGQQLTAVVSDHIVLYANYTLGLGAS